MMKTTFASSSLTAVQSEALAAIRLARRVEGPARGWRTATLRALARAGLITLAEGDDRWTAAWLPTQADLDEAAAELAARKSRVCYPDGHSDRAGRWYPTAEERQECCSAIRSPSREHPFGLLQHCTTAKHVAALYGIELAALNAAAKEVKDVQYRLLGALEDLDADARRVAIGLAPTWVGTAEELRASTAAILQ